jgi:hypothetical protein
MAFEDKDITKLIIITTTENSIYDFQLHNNFNDDENQAISQIGCNNTNNSNSNNNRNTNNNFSSSNVWKKPLTDQIKRIYDANLSHDGYWGLGAIFCDEQGQLLAAATWKYPGGDDSAMAEALELYNTINLAVDYDFHSVILESDNEMVIWFVNETAQLPRTYMRTLI